MTFGGLEYKYVFWFLLFSIGACVVFTVWLDRLGVKKMEEDAKESKEKESKSKGTKDE
jgi:hypothetical protein